MLASSYPFIEVFWTILIFFCFVVWIWLLFVVFTDLFRRHDIGGWGRTGWIVLVVVLPYFGVFVYLVAEQRGMTERTVRAQERADVEMEGYVRSVAGKTDPTQQIAKGEELLGAGVISREEFDRIKSKALAG